MIYRHRFTVKSSLSDVADFHYQKESLAQITPPPIRVSLEQVPNDLRQGGVMKFTLWLGFFPIRWEACIENPALDGFTDRQMNGPFKAWNHRHAFRAIHPDLTEVVDEVHYQVSRQPDKLVIGIGMALGLPALFAYRGWKTRRLVQGRK